jgi:hypothetical protein
MNQITLPNWYQLDFTTLGDMRRTIREVILIVDKLLQKKLITKWFYLYAGETIRVRFKSSKKMSQIQTAIKKIITDSPLNIHHQHKLEKYSEDKELFSQKEVMERFANIMVEITQLSVAKFNKKIDFGNYRMTKHITHCIFNNIYGLDVENYFLLKRLGCNLELNNRQDDPDQTVLSDKIELITVKDLTLTISTNVPFKKMTKK